MGTTGSSWLPNRLANASVSCVIYLRQMVWPSGLAALYPYPWRGTPAWEVALAALILGGISVAAWMNRDKRPWFAVGWVWYLLMLLPVLGIIQVGQQAHADRFTYLPQIGLYVALTWLGSEWMLERWRVNRLVLGSLMSGMVLVLMIVAWRQVGFWRNRETLWTHTLACTTSNYFALDNLGFIDSEQGKKEKAIQEFEMAVQLRPGSADLRNHLGTVLRQTGRVDDAITQYRIAITLKPKMAEPHYNLGLALMLKGFPAEAISAYGAALALEPDNPKIQNNLAWVLATCNNASLRNPARAIQLATAANELTGGTDPSILDTLAAAMAGAGKFTEATRTVRKAIELAKASGEKDLEAELNGELRRYQAGLTWSP
jgi:protein O-mannosyl-transferase